MPTLIMGLILPNSTIILAKIGMGVVFGHSHIFAKMDATRIDVNGFLMQNHGFGLIDSIKHKNNDYNSIK